MGQKISIDGIEYDVDKLSEVAKTTLASLQFATLRLQELNNMKALLLRAQNSYVETLKNEVVAEKAGFLFGDE